MGNDPGWLIHSCIAVVVTAATAMAGWFLGHTGLGAFIGALVASIFFGAREYCQQMRGQRPPKSPTWWPGNWGPHGQVESLAPAAIALSLAVAIATAASIVG
jgi:hypothetical protein